MRNPRYLAAALGLSIGLAATPLRAEEVPISEEAKAHFRAGVSFIDDPDGARYEEAYREFKVAYSISPSWKILGNLGLAAMKLERDGEAVQAYKRYLAEGGAQIEADEKTQVERDVQMLEAGVVLLQLESDPPGAVFLDERFPDAGSTVINRYGPHEGKVAIGVRAGRHRITARLDGYQDQSWSFEATPGGKFERVFKLEQVPAAAPGTTPAPGGVVVGPGAPVTSDRPIPTSVYVVGGVSLALAAGGAVVGLMASGKNSDYKALNGNLQSDADKKKAEGLKDDGEMLNLVADGLFAGAVIGAGVTIVLYATRPTATPTAGSLRFVPVVAANGGGGVLTGRF